MNWFQSNLKAWPTWRRRRLCASAREVIASIIYLVASVAAAQGLSGDLGIHDPSTVTKLGNKYFLYGTGQGISAKQSNDRLYWSNMQSVFPSTSPPSWTTTAVPGFQGNFWAPDVAYFDNEYHMYYSVSTFGSQTSAIGLVTNPTLDPTALNYLWTDQGPVIQSAPGANYNTIDPSIIKTPEGRIWMSFGSYWNGIYMTELNPTTGKRLSTSTAPTRVADNSSIEASYAYKHGNYYYLFVNYGTCCSGVNSTYNIRVARSTSVTGPYLDRAGLGMINNGGGTLFLGSEGQYIGPGHIGIFEDQGVEWFGYHYYNGNANGAPTYNLRSLLWSPDGWPMPGPSFIAAGDVNMDGSVDITDFNIISDHLFQTVTARTAGDLNGDGVVSYTDFHLWKASYGGGAGGADSSIGVPEPASGRSLVLGFLSFLLCWRTLNGRPSTVASRHSSK